MRALHSNSQEASSLPPLPVAEPARLLDRYSMPGSNCIRTNTCAHIEPILYLEETKDKPKVHTRDRVMGLLRRQTLIFSHRDIWFQNRHSLLIKLMINIQDHYVLDKQDRQSNLEESKRKPEMLTNKNTRDCHGFNKEAKCFGVLT